MVTEPLKMTLLEVAIVWAHRPHGIEMFSVHDLLTNVQNEMHTVYT